MPREVTNYKFGESAVMPQGKPYMLSIEGSDKVYSLVHRIDDAGQIHMTVDVADQASLTDRRRSMQDARPTARRRVDDDDDGPFDPKTGLLRDGRSLHVPLELADGRNRNAPLILNSGVHLERFFYPDGTPRDRRDTEPRRSRRARQTDATPTDDHRPHFADADRSASEQARQQRMIEDSNAWRGPQASPPATTADAAPPAGVSASDFARFQMIQDQASAWQPRDAAATEIVPAGAYAKAGLGVRPGDFCQVNGVGGRVVQKGDWLFCETNQPGPTRSGTSSGDSMSAADGEALKAAAWNEMVADLSSAWKTPA